MGQPYNEAVSTFSFDKLASSLNGSFEHGINGCVECCDRHAATDHPALIWMRTYGVSQTFTFASILDRAKRFADLLNARGIVPGDVIAGLLPRTPDLLAVILGTWRVGAVYLPLFTAFGPKAIEYRLNASRAQMIVTDAANRAKLEDVDTTAAIATIGGTRGADIDVYAEMARMPAAARPVMLKGDDPFLMMFTSGTTGPAKHLLVPLRALLSFIVYLRESVDLRPNDVFWNMADPGWAYGLYYAVTGPLLLGQTTILYEGAFDVDAFYRIIDRLQVNVLVGSPTAYRLIKAAGPEPAAQISSRLRVVSSGGEPLDADVVRWFGEHLHAPIGDHYGQTEGGMMVCNHHALDHPKHMGSAGMALPGFRVVILDENDCEVLPNTPGILAVDRHNSPLFWFNGYAAQSVAGRYYRTGDVAHMDPDGSVYFDGRADDVITTAGYRVGPYDVESALLEHPSVREVAVIGKPDVERTEIIKAFVVAKPGQEVGPRLTEELSQFVRRRLSAHAYPREIEFVTELPRTASGKIQRFLLREREARTAAKQ